MCANQSLLSLLVLNEEVRHLQREQPRVFELLVVQSGEEVGADLRGTEARPPARARVEQSRQHPPHQLQVQRVADGDDKAEQSGVAA